ncbi:MAG: hypothetical protein P9F19_01505 [Candidatus Contendobacter sp.]|nr:hypothetical protein [Candidatus Contendobacter sp.]MDG4556066.1 hypothetical protein [Candidatus Contendobacter sp.]
MKSVRFKLKLVGSVFALIAAPVLAGDIYRWVNPETGEKVMTSNPPPYPIKEQRPAGRLPNGDIIELTLDPNAPEVKAKLDAYKAKEAERKRIAEEEQRQRAAREAEEQRERAAREAEEQRQRAAREVEEQRQRAAREAAMKAKAEEMAKEQAAQEAAIEQVKQKVRNKMMLAKEKAKKDEDIDFFLKTIDEFEQQEKFASTTARISLAIPINNLLSIKTKLDAREVGSCYRKSKSTLQDWMKHTLNVYYEFSIKNEESSGKYRRLADTTIMLFWLEFPESC